MQLTINSENVNILVMILLLLTISLTSCIVTPVLCNDSLNMLRMLYINNKMLEIHIIKFSNSNSLLTDMFLTCLTVTF